MGFHSDSYEHLKADTKSREPGARPRMSLTFRCIV